MDLTSVNGFFDLAKGAIGVLVALLGLPFLKNINFHRNKSKKLKNVFDEYKEFLSESDKKLIENEIREDVMLSLTKVRNIKYRNIAIYIRTHSIINLPLWKWSHLLPHINYKNNRLYIRYNGKYLKYRISSKFVSIFYFAAGVYYWHVLNKTDESYGPISGLIIGLVFITFSIVVWNIFPSEKAIAKINRSLIAIDTKDLKL
ncbi:hypothetical protein [Citrobacter sp. Cb028]|uniref:hypothetical protein n=1 Tax=Citrobacter sp. Cb028 TaxID=2985024 RepID=UPI0025788068|nr:hypothetical protein [Citrobacter sp. Cb028]MDM3453205.1 hypothetical protein [Citrobacter sp. Cb028]